MTISISLRVTIRLIPDITFIHDYSITTQSNSFLGRNIRYPQWYGELNFNESAIAQLYLDKGVTIARSPEKLSPDEYIKIISDIPLEFSPGEYFNYSISTDILGFIIERISGMTLEEYLSEKIIVPLGMNDTTFHIDKSKLDRFSSCYIYDEIAD